MGDFFGGLGKTVNALRTSAMRSAARAVNSSGVETYRTENLDLTFITPRIVAMGGVFTRLSSKTGANMKGDVLEFVQRHSDTNFRFFNVGAHKYEDFPDLEIEQKYLEAGTLKSLRRLFRACKAIYAYLQRDPSNVAVILCEDGLANTGTVIAALFCSCHFMPVADDAINVFARKRAVGSRSLLSESQRRYVGYIHSLVSDHPPHARELRLTSVVLRSVPSITSNLKGCRPFVVVLVGPNPVFDSRQDGAPPSLVAVGEDTEVALDVTVLGDVRIQIWHHATFMSKDSSRLVCQVQFHTGYVTANRVIFPSHVLDNESRRPLDPGFELQVVYKQGEAHDERLAWTRDNPIDPAVHRSVLFSNDDQRTEFLRDFAMMKGGGGQAGDQGRSSQPFCFSDDEDEDFADATLKDVRGSREKEQEDALQQGGDFDNAHDVAEAGVVEEANTAAETGGHDVAVNEEAEGRVSVEVQGTRTDDNEDDVAAKTGHGVDDVSLGAGHEPRGTWAEDRAASATENGWDAFAEDTKQQSGQQPQEETGGHAQQETRDAHESVNLLDFGHEDEQETPVPPSRLVDLSLDDNVNAGGARAETNNDNTTSADTRAPNVPAASASGNASQFASNFTTSQANSDLPSSHQSSADLVMEFHNLQAEASSSSLNAELGDLLQPTPAAPTQHQEEQTQHTRDQRQQQQRQMDSDDFFEAFMRSKSTGSLARDSVGPTHGSKATADPFSGLHSAGNQSRHTQQQSQQQSQQQQQQQEQPREPTGRAPPSSSSTRPQPGARAHSATPFSSSSKPDKFGGARATTAPKTGGDMFGDLLGDPRFKQKSGPQTLASLSRASRAKTEDPIALAIEAWIEGRKNNVRALLAALPDVLWEDSGWKPIAISDLMDANRVRKAYKRACLLLHPDKHEAMQSPHLPLAKEIFIQLSQAFETFENSPQ